MYLRNWRMGGVGEEGTLVKGDPMKVKTLIVEHNGKQFGLPETALLTLLDEPKAPLEFLHWGTTTKDHDAYPRKRAFGDLKAIGIDFTLGHAPILSNIQPIHWEVFGRAAGALVTDSDAVRFSTSKAFFDGLEDAPVITMNSEAKEHTGQRNAKTRNLLTGNLRWHPNPGCMWTHDGFSYREQYNTPERWAACTHASSWVHVWPNVHTPEWMLFDGPYGRSTGLPLGYLVVELNDCYLTGRPAAADCITRALMFAALQQPKYVGIYGWWRVWDKPEIVKAVQTGIEWARTLHTLIAGWARVKPDINVVINREGWSYPQTIMTRQICGALSREGFRYDVNGAGEYAVTFSPNNPQAINGMLFNYNKYATWGRPYYLDSRNHWRQHEAEEEAEHVVNLIEIAGAEPLLKSGCAACELFEYHGERMLVAVNAKMKYPAGEGPFAGKSIAEGQGHIEVVEQPRVTRWLDRFDFATFSA